MPYRALLVFTMCLAAQRASCADGWGGSLALTSDYILRGVSQSNGSPAVQGDIHFQSNAGWNAGVWASSIKLDPTDSTAGEVNVFAGFGWPLGADWNAKIQAVHYAYPLNRPIDGYDYDELVAALSFRDTLYVTVSYSPDTTRFSYYGLAKDRSAYTADAEWRVPLYRDLSAAAGAGVYRLQDPARTQYYFWNVGLSYAFHAFQLDLSYIGASDAAKTLFYSDTAYGDAASRHWSATLLMLF